MKLKKEEQEATKKKLINIFKLLEDKLHDMFFGGEIFKLVYIKKINKVQVGTMSSSS